FFNTCQIAVTTWVAATAFVALGGPAAGLLAGRVATHGDLTALRLAPAMIGLFAGYLLTNRVLVSAAVAWHAERPYVRVLREDWFYLERLMQDLSAFLLSPLMVVSF